MGRGRGRRGGEEKWDTTVDHYEEEFSTMNHPDYYFGMIQISLISRCTGNR